MQNKILSLFESILGESQHTTKDNHSFHCPTCNHRKKKLEVDVGKGVWHCWVCNKGGKNFYSLLRWINAPQSRFDELRSILGTFKRAYSSKAEYDSVVCELPKEFKPLWVEDSKNFNWRASINYLRKRGIERGDILKYGIGYCESGAYGEMIVIPSYDISGKLNYFTTRSFLPGASIKFKNPPVKKNVVGFELMINWGEPIVLVESAFDAIAIKRNAIPLFGKTISLELRKKIINRNVKDINICLDGDAISDAINHVQYFLGNGLNVKVTELPFDEDPSSLGHKEICRRLDNAIQFDETLLFERRIKDHLNGEGKTNLPRRRYTLPSVSAAQRISGSFRSDVSENKGVRNRG